MRTTIKDIAAYCKVSEGTVDRALNNRFGISEKTKARILEAVELMNYRPNNIGRALATGAIMTIGIFCFDLYNNFFPQLIDTIEARAKEKGYFINLILTHMDQQKEREGLEYISAHGVDGVILFPIGQGEEYIRYLQSLHIPIVTVYNYLSDDFPYVGVDNRKACSDAVDFLVKHNYERIVFATPYVDVQESLNNNVYTLKTRLMGYCDGILHAGLTPNIVQGREYAVQTALHFARRDDGVRTAILCSSDSYALTVYGALQDENVPVPGKIGIMGFDHINMIGLTHPRLTTVGYSIEEMGVLLFESLHQLILGEDVARSNLLPYSIVPGETV